MITATSTLTEPSASRLPAFARLPVLAVGACVALVLIAASRNYGYFFDEAYFVIAGRDHLAWGYFDQPPLVPFLAGLSDRLFPGSLIALRLPASLAAAGSTVLTGLIARELGGRRAAQVVAAIAAALTGATIVAHYLATYSLDPFFWTLILFLVVRWVRQWHEGRADDRLLFAAGLVTAVSLETKFLVPALWVLLLAGALIFGPRALVRRPLLWLGLGVATLATVPTLVWQATHGWPYLRMQAVVQAEFPGVGGFLWDSLTGAGLFIGIPLVLIGLGWLLAARRFRFLGVALLALVLAYLASSGRAYYVYSSYAPMLAAGMVALQRVRWPVVLRWLGGVLVAASVAGWLLVMPVYPASVAAKLPGSLPLVPTTARMFLYGDQLLDQLTDAMAAIYQQLPPDQRAHTAIMTDSYAFAAAVDLLGPARGLPRAYSGHRGYYYFGRPPESATAVLFFGDPQPAMAGAFTGKTEVSPGFATLYSGRKQPWTTLWPELRSQ